MDNSAVIVILNVWDIWRYNWLAAFIRETLTDRKEETGEEFFAEIIERLKSKLYLKRRTLFDIIFNTKHFN